MAPTVVPGDGSAHLGLVLNVFDPLPCTKGYEATPRRAGNEVADTPVNAQAHCAEPDNSPIDVRDVRGPAAGTVIRPRASAVTRARPTATPRRPARPSPCPLSCRPRRSR